MSFLKYRRSRGDWNTCCCGVLTYTLINKKLSAWGHLPKQGALSSLKRTIMRQSACLGWSNRADPANPAVLLDIPKAFRQMTYAACRQTDAIANWAGRRPSSWQPGACKGRWFHW